jgi:serine/threonine-protein kinase SRK2
VQTQTDLGPGHINLINVYELFLTPDCLGLVMECGHGGSMTTYVSGKWKDAAENGLILQEDEALYLFKQFISAVSYCHRHDLAHRCGLHAYIVSF